MNQLIFIFVLLLSISFSQFNKGHFRATGSFSFTKDFYDDELQRKVTDINSIWSYHLSHASSVDFIWNKRKYTYPDDYKSSYTEIGIGGTSYYYPLKHPIYLGSYYVITTSKWEDDWYGNSDSDSDEDSYLVIAGGMLVELFPKAFIDCGYRYLMGQDELEDVTASMLTVGISILIN